MTDGDSRFGRLKESPRWRPGVGLDPTEPWIRRWTAQGGDGAEWVLVTDDVADACTLWCRPRGGGEFRYELECIDRFAVGVDGSLDMRFRSENTYGMVWVRLDPDASIDLAHLEGDPPRR